MRKNKDLTYFVSTVALFSFHYEISKLRLERRAFNGPTYITINNNVFEPFVEKAESSINENSNIIFISCLVEVHSIMSLNGYFVVSLHGTHSPYFTWYTINIIL